MMFGEGYPEFPDKISEKAYIKDDTDMVVANRNTYGLDVQDEEKINVLTATLLRLCFFHPIENDADAALHNAALRVLHDCGIWREGNSREIIQALARAVVVFEEEIVDE